MYQEKASTRRATEDAPLAPLSPLAFLFPRLPRPRPPSLSLSTLSLQQEVPLSARRPQRHRLRLSTGDLQAGHVHCYGCMAVRSPS
jgi:hypothetical protein